MPMYVSAKSGATAGCIIKNKTIHAISRETLLFNIKSMLCYWDCLLKPCLQCLRYCLTNEKE